MGTLFRRYDISDDINDGLVNYAVNDAPCDRTGKFGHATVDIQLSSPTIQVKYLHVWLGSEKDRTGRHTPWTLLSEL